jgi:hypothetical protein
LWNKWYDLGILEPSQKRKGRPQKIYSLDDVGIEIPSIPTAEEKPPEPSETTQTKGE